MSDILYVACVIRRCKSLCVALKLKKKSEFKKKKKKKELRLRKNGVRVDVINIKTLLCQRYNELKYIVSVFDCANSMIRKMHCI